MKVTKEKSAENRAALVAAASRLFQELGFDGAGVADISSEAGLTQGAFYAQFGSKAALAVEACRASHDQGLATWRSVRGKASSDAAAFIDQYFRKAHIEDPGKGCPVAAYAAEVPRQDKALASVFIEGFKEMVGLMEEALAAEVPEEIARSRALFFISAMAGSVSMARAAAVVSPALSKEIVAAAKAEMKNMILRA